MQRESFEFEKLARMPDVTSVPESVIASLDPISDLDVHALVSDWTRSNAFAQLMTRARQESVGDAQFAASLAQSVKLADRIDGDLIATKVCKQLTRAWVDEVCPRLPAPPPASLQATGRNYRRSTARPAAERNKSAKSIAVTVLGGFTLFSGALTPALIYASTLFTEELSEPLSDPRFVRILIGVTIGATIFNVLLGWGLVTRRRAARTVFLVITAINLMFSFLGFLIGGCAALFSIALCLAMIWLLIQPEIVDEFDYA